MHTTDKCTVNVELRSLMVERDVAKKIANKTGLKRDWKTYSYEIKRQV